MSGCVGRCLIKGVGAAGAKTRLEVVSVRGPARSTITMRGGLRSTFLFCFKRGSRRGRSTWVEVGAGFFGRGWYVYGQVNVSAYYRF